MEQQALSPDRQGSPAPPYGNLWPELRPFLLAPTRAPGASRHRRGVRVHFFSAI